MDLQVFYNNLNKVTVQVTSRNLYSIYIEKPLFVMSVLKFFSSVHDGCGGVADYFMEKIFDNYYLGFNHFVRFLYDCGMKKGYNVLVNDLIFLYYLNGLAVNHSQSQSLSDVDLVIKSVQSFMMMFKNTVELNSVDFVKLFKSEHDVQSLMFFMMKMLFARVFHIVPEFSSGKNRFDIVVSFNGVNVGVELKYIVDKSRLEFLRSVIDQVHKYLSSGRSIDYLFIVIVYNKSVGDGVERIVDELKFENLYEKRFSVISVCV